MTTIATMGVLWLALKLYERYSFVEETETPKTK